TLIRAGDAIVVVAAEQLIADASAAVDLVVAGVAGDGVGARATVENIRSAFAENLIVARFAIRLIARIIFTRAACDLAVDDVVAIAAEESVRTGIAREAVIAGSAKNFIAVVAAFDRIVAGIAANHIRSGVAEQG